MYSSIAWSSCANHAFLKLYVESAYLLLIVESEESFEERKLFSSQALSFEENIERRYLPGYQELSSHSELASTKSHLS